MIEHPVQRRADIDRAKGLGIILVVFGHLVARADPAGVDWYEPLRRAVYTFHMPLFFYLSGLVLVLSGATSAPSGQWQKWALKRAKRLLLPFMALGLLVLAGKLILARLIFVDHAPDGIRAGLDGLIWHTSQSPDGSIWYLFVLFIYSVATPLCLRGRRHFGWLLAVCLAAYAVPVAGYFYADDLARYAIFFLCGVWCGLHYEDWQKIMRRCWKAALILLALLLTADAMYGQNWPPSVMLLPAGLCAMPALHGLVRYSWARSNPVFLWTGRHCFMIYFFNTMFIGLAKGLLLRVADWDGAHFLPFAAVLMASGILGPVAMKRLAFQRLAWLDRMTD